MFSSFLTNCLNGTNFHSNYGTLIKFSLNLLIFHFDLVKCIIYTPTLQLDTRLYSFKYFAISPNLIKLFKRQDRQLKFLKEN